MKVVGFVTRVMAEDGSGREMASVFIPTTPNPTGGYLVVVPLDELTPTDWTMDQAMAFIISGGAVAPRPCLRHQPRCRMTMHVSTHDVAHACTSDAAIHSVGNCHHDHARHAVQMRATGPRRPKPPSSTRRRATPTRWPTCSACSRQRQA
jgi:hypothetical protein